MFSIRRQLAYTFKDYNIRPRDARLAEARSVTQDLIDALSASLGPVVATAYLNRLQSSRSVRLVAVLLGCAAVMVAGFVVAAPVLVVMGMVGVVRVGSLQHRVPVPDSWRVWVTANRNGLLAGRPNYAAWSLVPDPVLDAQFRWLLPSVAADLPAELAILSSFRPYVHSAVDEQLAGYQREIFWRMVGEFSGTVGGLVELVRLLDGDMSVLPDGSLVTN